MLMVIIGHGTPLSVYYLALESYHIINRYIGDTQAALQEKSEGKGF